MLDVEYLLARPPYEGAMIYRYRSGVLRPAVMAALRDVAMREDRLIVEGNLRELSGFSGGSLWATLPVCEWSQASVARLSPSDVEDALAGLASGAGERSAHFLPAKSPLTKHPAWSAVEAACFVVEEPVITSETLLPALRYFEATTDLADKPSFSADPAFVASFDELLERDGADLPDVIRAFDDRVLTCTDWKTNRFDGHQHHRAVLHRQGRTSPLQPLRALVADRDGWDLVHLVMSLDERHWQGGGTVQALVAELYRVTRALLCTHEKARWHRNWSRADKDAYDLNVVLWAALVIAWEERLTQASHEAVWGYRRGPDLLVVTLDQLGRDFLDRAGRETAEDRLAGLWPELRCGLMKVAGCHSDHLASARSRVVNTLALNLEERAASAGPPWLARLGRSVTQAVAEAERSEAEEMAE